MKIGKFPRLRITHGPTPLEPMPRLTAALGGTNMGAAMESLASQLRSRCRHASWDYGERL